VSRTRTGVVLALATALISGVSIFLNSYAVKQIADAALFTTLKNGVAAVVLLAVALTVVRRADVRRLERREWLGVGLVGVVGGGIAFLLFFTGLAMASAPSAAFIHKTLFVWVALLAVPFLGERLGPVSVAALVALLAAQLLIAPPAGVRWGMGESMIALATLLWAGETVVARRLLVGVPVGVLAVGRLGIGLFVLAGYLVVTGRLAQLGSLTAIQLAWAIGTGVLLAGYVATWFSALSRAPATIVTSVLVIGAPITAILAGIASGVAPAPAQLAGYGLIVLAVGAILAALVWREKSARQPVLASG
jgi:drug/metabolite transporter (DMT)-like permease